MKSRLIIKYSIFYLLIIARLGCLAQLAQTKRVEFEVNWSNGYYVYEFGDKGIITVDKSVNKLEKEVILSYSKFNSDLKNEGEKLIAVRYLKGVYKNYASDNLYTLQSNTKKGAFDIIIVKPSPFKVEKHQGALLPRFTITKFLVQNGISYMAGIYKKKPKLVTYNLNTKSSQYIDLGASENAYSSIDKIYLTESGEVHVLIVSCESKKSCMTTIIPFDKAGKKMKTILVKDTDIYKISSARATPTSGNNEQLVTGTYSLNSYNSAKGIYVSKYNDSNREFIKFYDFLDFKNFLSYLPDRKKKKIERKNERKKKKGKEIKLEFRILMHEIIELKNEYVLIGEAYYPTYRTVTYTTYVNGAPVVQSYQVFDGYQYSHVTVASFSKRGEMIWSNSFEMWLTYKPYFPKPFIQTKIEGQAISMLFCDGNKIQSSKILNGEVKIEKELDFIDTGNENDNVKWTSASEMVYWYDNYFVAYGFQKIKDQNKRMGKKTRKVFYMNKIRY